MKRGASTGGRDARDDASDVQSQSSAGSAKAGLPHQQDEGAENSADQWLTGLFGVGFTVMKEKSPGWGWASFRLFADVYQMFLLIVAPQYGWTGWVNYDNIGWQVFSWVGLSQFMTQRGYTFYSVCLYGISALLVFNIALCFWVGAAFRAANFNTVWPVLWLRWFGKIAYQVLDIATLSLLLIALDCQSYYAANKGFNAEFPDVYCWSGVHMGAVAVAAIGLVLFILSAAFFTLAEVELDPLSKNPLAMSNSMVELWSFVLRLIMTVTQITLYDPRHSGVAYSFCSLMLVYLYVRWVPHQTALTNYIRCGSYMLLLYASLILLVMSVKAGSMTDPDAVAALYQSSTTAMWAGLAPAFLLGAGLAWLRLAQINRLVERVREEAAADGKLIQVVQLTDPRMVEIMARCCRAPNPDDPFKPKPEAFALAEIILKEGLSQMPSNAYMVVLFSSFLIDCLGSYKSGFNLLQQAAKRNPTFLERYAIFSREQQHAQKASSLQSGVAASDLVSFVEYQRSYTMARQAHKDALVAIRIFWTILLTTNIKFEVLATAAAKAGDAIKHAERTYRTVLARHSLSVRIVTLYAKFLKRVKQDPWGAARWQNEADILTLAEEQAKNTNQFAELDGLDALDPGLRELLTGENTSKDQRAVVLVNAQGVITLANQTCHDMLGYAPGELKLKQLHILMPSPFSENHTSYLRTNLGTGTKVINRVNEAVALHKESHLLAVQLAVCKISGIGEDTVFLGTMLPKPQPASTARLWCDVGGKLLGSCDNFVDWAGWRPDELCGLTLLSLMADKSSAQLLKMLLTSGEEAITPADLARASDKQPSLSGPQYLSGNNPGVQPCASVTGVNLSTKLKAPECELSEHGLFPTPPIVAVSLPPPNRYLNKILRVSMHPAPECPSSLTLSLRHKYLGSVRVSATLYNSSIGSFRFQVITLTQAPAATRSVRASAKLMSVGLQCGDLVPKSLQAANQRGLGPPHMLVLDKKGRICHVTHGLAAALGSTPRALLELANQGAVHLDLLLPSPFSQLHRVHLTEMSHTPPPYSCRSGLSILLAGTDKLQHATTLPFKMQLSTTSVAESTSEVFVMQMEQVTLEAALSERRLRLVVDGSTGRVIKVADSSAKSLFGFEPQSLPGHLLSQVVNMLQSGKKQHSASTMARITARAFTHGEVSYRVGVLKPKSKVDALIQSTEGTPVNSATPALMVVRVLPTPSLGSTTSDQRSLSMLSLNLEQELDVLTLEVEDGPAAVSNLDDEEEAPSPKARDLKFSVSRSGSSAGTLKRVAAPGLAGFKAGSIVDAELTSEEEEDDKPLLLEVEIWKSELACSVVMVDSAGTVVPSDTSLPLYPAGLMFGGDAGGLDIAGLHLASILPQLAGVSMNALSEHQLLTGMAQLVLGPKGPVSVAEQQQAGRRGSVRVVSSLATAAGDLGRNRCGPMLHMSSKHMGDGQGLELAVQAVQRPGGGCWLIVHPYQPTCGSPELGAWLGEEHEQRNKPRWQQPVAVHGSRRNSTLMPTRELVSDAETNMKRVGSSTLLTDVDGDMDAGKNVRFGGPAPAFLALGKVSALPVQFKAPAKDSIHQWLSTGEPGAHESLYAPALMSGDLHATSFAGDGHVEGAVIQDMDMLADKLANLGSFTDQPVNLGVQAENIDDAEHEQEHTNDDTAYKRGRRVKRLLRVMNSVSAQAHVRRFRLHVPLLVLFVIAVHCVTYVMVTDSLQNQSTGVTALASAGSALWYAGEATMSAYFLQFIISNRASVDPTRILGLTNTPANFASMSKYLGESIANMWIQHQYVYLKAGDFIKRDPELVALWNEATTEMKVWSETPATAYQIANSPRFKTVFAAEGTVVGPMANGTYAHLFSSRKNVTMWELGQILVQRLDFAWRTAPNITINRDMQSTTSYLTAFENCFTGFADGYMATASSMVSVVIGNAKTVQTAQLLLLTLEGVVLTFLVAIWVWVVTVKVGMQRLLTFQVFVQVPQGQARALATCGFDLDDEEDEDGGDAGMAGEAPQQLAGTATGTPFVADMEAKHGHSRSAAAAHTVGTFGPRPAGVNAPVLPTSSLGETQMYAQQKSRSFSFAAMKKAAGKALLLLMPSLHKHPAVSRRKLQPSVRSLLVMTLPILLWGLMIVIINVVGLAEVSTVSLPISLFNLVNLVTNDGKAHVAFNYFVFSSESAAEADHYRLEVARQNILLKRDLDVLLMGKDQFPLAQFPWMEKATFQLVTKGVVAAGGTGVRTLFSTTECLRFNQSTCLKPTSPYYGDVMNGLMRLMQRRIDISDGMQDMIGTNQPNLTSYDFGWLLNTRADARDGLALLVRDYKGFALAVYSRVLMTHTVGLAITIVFWVAYLLFIYWPSLKVFTGEGKTVAELLSQLPPETDVDGIMIRLFQQDVGYKTDTPTPAIGGMRNGSAHNGSAHNKNRSASSKLLGN